MMRRLEAFVHIEPPLSPFWHPLILRKIWQTSDHLTMGFSDELFETPPSQHLICAVCHDVFRDASMLRCGHTFCHNCIIKTLSRAAAGSCRCPICRVPTYGVKDISPNLITRQLISDLPMRCVQGEYRRQRCGWKGTVAQWTAHCAKDCPNQDLRCNLE